MTQFIATLQGESCLLEVQELSSGKIQVVSDGQTWILDARKIGPHHYSVIDGFQSYDLLFSHKENQVEVVGFDEPISFLLEEDSVYRKLKQSQSRGTVLADQDAPLKVHSLMPGKVVQLKVSVGDCVSLHQSLLVLEAMKMENEILSNKAGTIVDVCVEEGQSVESGTLMVVIQ